MEDYKTLLQVILLLICLFFIYLLIKYIRSIIMRNRLSYYSLNLDDESFEYKSFYKIISKFSTFLNSLVIFNGLARTYNKYIYDDSKLRKGIDYISLKFISGILMILLYLFLAILYKNDILLYLVLVCFVLGFLLPDFYCFFKEKHYSRISNQDILRAVIIMENSYKVNKSTEQVLEDVIKRSDGRLKNEFIRVLNDIRIGLEIPDAFYRMYYRTGIEVLKNIAEGLKVVIVSGINPAMVFEEIEKSLIMKERFLQEISVYLSVNKIAHLVFLLLPLIFIVCIFLFNKSYVDILLSDIGVFLVLILGIVYLLYMLFLRSVVKGNINEEE